MAAETYTYIPKKFIAGSDPDYVAKPCTVVSGQNLAAGSVVEFDINGKVITSGGVNRPAGVLAYAVNASVSTTNNKGETVAAGVAADTAGILIKCGDLFSSELFFNATQSTNLLKAKLMDGTMIVLSFQDVGEV
jgi:hypothetical protein